MVAIERIVLKIKKDLAHILISFDFFNSDENIK